MTWDCFFLIVVLRGCARVREVSGASLRRIARGAFIIGLARFAADWGVHRGTGAGDQRKSPRSSGAASVHAGAGSGENGPADRGDHRASGEDATPDRGDRCARAEAEAESIEMRGGTPEDGATILQDRAAQVAF